ncbi:Ig-like domain-containing protein [Solirubrobacter ginsenosidimutans]|uniref:Ig-like domain-containing protein n=1 Tax=Solirubrobacter ginsenosidimutans TaxID=490573 RepID=A0A9X3N2C7_9ACTN|nr:Ig-like domain-containing protein [Solirubrobacter ginsenosidimutans]MDA0167007.1 Ig-like domain-containing protein [Solirubrobacter ginsenosidimutans]
MLRETVAPSYQVIAASSPAVAVAGINTFTTDLDVLQGDTLALEWDGGSVSIAVQAGATNSDLEATIGSAPTVTFNDHYADFALMYNAQLVAPVATTVDVDAPSSTTIGGQSTYAVHVDRQTGSDRSVIGGTVSLTDGGTPITGCQSVPVTAGEASCTTTLAGVAGNHFIGATYSGDSPFETSTGSVHFSAKAVTATAAGTSVEGPFDPSAAIVYTAKVTPAPNAGFVSALAHANTGTVAFSVDGTAIAACATRAVDTTSGLASCATTAPADGLDHVVKASYSGGTFYVASAGESPFKLNLPADPTPPAPPTPPTPPVTSPVAPPTGAVFAPGQPTTLPASAASTPTVTVPVRCPAGDACEVEGTVTVSTSIKPRAARAVQAAPTATVARFSRVHIAGGKVKKLKLRLDPAFVRKASKQGLRRVKGTLTIVTTLGGGQKVTTHQQVTIVLPKAKKQQAAPHFTG